MRVYFDVQQLYYIPQYVPLQKELTKKGVECTFVFYRDFQMASQQKSVADSLKSNIHWVSNNAEAKALYIQDKPDWLIIGNYFDDLESLHAFTKTALLSHGIGPKACYYTVSDSMPTVRFVEGPYRTKRLQDLYPHSKFVDTGYAKLDPVINGQYDTLNVAQFGLDPTKKTILYAPTFYPSSIECFHKNFPTHFAEYNIIVKPHYFSLVSATYKKQKALMLKWSQHKNVYLAGVDDVNILPFMAISDVLISDASSTLFEFAALDKPIVWCDFYKLRLGYRGLFKFRFDNRMDEDLYKYADIAAHASNYKKLKRVVDEQILNPELKQNERKKHTLALAGIVDGKVSQRVVNYIIGNKYE